MFLSSFVAVGLDDESCGRVIPFQTPGSSMDAIAVPAATRLHHKRHHNGVNTVARDGGGEGIETPRSSDRSIQAVERSSTTVWKSDPVSSHRPQAVQGTKPTLEGNGARDSCPVSSSVTVDRSKETSARKTTHRRVGRCTSPAELLGKETHVGHTHWKKLSKKKMDSNWSTWGMSLDLNLGEPTVAEVAMNLLRVQRKVDGLVEEVKELRTEMQRWINKHEGVLLWTGTGQEVPTTRSNSYTYWSPSEEARLLDAHRKHSGNWGKVCEALRDTGKSKSQMRSKYSRMTKKRTRSRQDSPSEGTS